MAKPAILTVDDDPAVSQAITRDLRRQYGSEYQIVRATSGAEGLNVLTELAVRERPVALIASDQRMPEMTGIEFFERARPHAQDAKLVLLTAYADTDVAIRAINDLGLDYYLLKPWDPPGERLYPVLDDLLSDWRREHVDELGGVRVVGHRWSERSHELKTFLARNHVPYRWLDLERDAEAGRLATLAGGGDDALPLVFVPDGETLHAPSLVDLADALGLRTHAEQPLYDLCIVGGGPAGLAAAVYAASEGLQTVVIEREAPGGQAGQSAAIEKYLGFPKGLSGADLTQRAVAQAARFGAEMVLARDVVNFEARGPVRCVSLGTEAEIEARSLLVATGVSYRMLDAPGLAVLTGRGVFYGATASEARSTRDADVYIVGAANSAGQAALNLARFASRVVLLVRSDALEKSMSRYLVERICATTNIEVRLQSEVVKGRGNEHLEAITIADRAAGTEEEFETEWLFVFIGASPRTDWLGDGVVRDDKGFIITGHDLLTHAAAARWPLSRIPYTLETSVPGVFAAGDVRLDSMKRVASAVGEGAMSVYLVHRYLRDDLMLVDDLRALFLLESLSDAQIEELAAIGEEIAFEEGTTLFEEGKPADNWWVLIEGRIELLRRTGNEVAVFVVMDRPGVWAGGFRAWSSDMGYMSTGRTAGTGRVLRVPAEALGEHVRAWFAFGVHLIEGLFQTVRNMEAISRQREKLVSLGTMAAGLAHEINNPASAIARAVDALSDNCQTLVSAPTRLAEAALTSEQFLALEALRQEIDPSAAVIDPLALADREEALNDWLEERGIADAWQLAATLASVGVEPAWCQRVADALHDEGLEAGLDWLAGTLSSTALLGEIREANRRISDLVAAMKSYSQVDRASMQLIDVTEGIESTLVMLAHKLRSGITIERDFAHGATRLEADPSELNQVWMNLIDNAIDAMSDGGTLRVSTCVDGDHLVAEVADTGIGMPVDVRERAFDAFFTTKDVGKGSGLGLDISRRIVVERHHGGIEIDSAPGRTVLRVQLPLRVH